MSVKAKPANSPPPPPVVSATAGGQVHHGRIPDRRADPSSLPQFERADVLPYTTTFVLLWHSNKWEFLRSKARPDGEWLPTLNAFRIMPGANRVREGGAMGLANTVNAAAGFHQIPLSEGPDGNYVRVFDVVMKPKGTIKQVYRTAWEVVLRNGDECMIQTDLVRYRAWLRDLVARRVIEPPPRYVALRYVRKKQARIERYLTLPADNEVAKERIRKERELLALMAKAFHAQFGFDPLEEGAEDAHFGKELRDAQMGDQSSEEAIS